VSKNPAIDDEELGRLKADVDRATGELLKRAQNRKDAPIAYGKLKEFLAKIKVAVEHDWPRIGMRPKRKPLKALSRACSKADRWLKENPDPNEIDVHDVQLLFERVRTAFENVKTTLKSSKAGTL
jgi:hypothetical protein